MHNIKSLDELLTSRDENLYNTVIEVSNWLEDNEIKDERGLRWKSAPESDTDYKNVPFLDDKTFYGGSAGIGLFYIRLYLVSKEEKYIYKAIDAANYLIDTYEEDKDRKEPGFFSSGYYNGPSGQGYFSEILYQVLKDVGNDASKYHEFALKVADDLVDSIRKVDDKASTWTHSVAMVSDGSDDLYLLYMYERTGDQRYLDTAVSNGYYFISQAEDAPVGKRWYAMDVTNPAFNFKEKGYFPNFFYGTSGNAYLLALLYKYTKEEIFLEYAKAGALYIESVAHVKDGTTLIPYNVPNRENIFYLGMCQGPVGTTRLYRLLYELTHDSHYSDYVIKLTDGILATGAPQIHSPGYWKTYCYCCGAAGMLELFIQVNHFFNIEDYSDAASDAAITLIGDSFVSDHKRRWYTQWTRILPKDVEAYTGLFHGSTGCANALLTLYNELSEHIELPGFLEDYWVKG